MKTTLLRSYYRNGQIYQEAPLRNGVPHGVVRIWHRNGRLATEQPYENARLHGVCRQWSEGGQLLGEYQMVHGTGLQRSWHDNRMLQSEFFTLAGRFSGRCRNWLEDGTLVSDRLFLNGGDVSPQAYRRAAAQDTRLPKLIGRPVKVNADSPRHQRHLFNVLVARLLRKSPVEARTWLAAGEGKRRSLGHFRMARHALKSNAGKCVNELYQAGAVQVLVPDIYYNEAGDQFADSLLVKLPKDKARRAAIRKVTARLRAKNLGGVEPGNDTGENYLYLAMG